MTPTDNGPPTLRLVPLDDLVAFVRLVQAMRKSQRFYHGRHDPEALRVARDYERRVDARCSEFVNQYHQTPSLFSGENEGSRSHA